ncbi:MAG: PqqD family peptide modification chaperone [Firmicutes bacterium]|nr:PqqD family peptide modification chaperone [Bacillota bacterium]
MEMNSNIVMKKKLNVTDLAGEKVMIDFETGKYFLVKGVGNDIWDMLQKETTPAEIIDNLLKEYDVTPQECEKSVMDFLNKLNEQNFLG